MGGQSGVLQAQIKQGPAQRHKHGLMGAEGCRQVRAPRQMPTSHPSSAADPN